MTMWDLLDPIYDPADVGTGDGPGLDADTVRELCGDERAPVGRGLLTEEVDAGR